MANALMDKLSKKDRDTLNAILSTQTISGDSGGLNLDNQPNNALMDFLRPQQMPQAAQSSQASQPQQSPMIDNSRLAQMQNDPRLQPMNTIQTSSGQFITPQGTRTNAPVEFNSNAQAQQMQGTPIDVFGKKGILRPDGSIVGQNSDGTTWTARSSEDVAAQQAQQDAALKRQMMQAQLEDVQAQAKMRQAELAGGGAVKPTFNADMGGYIYPPSAENPQGKFVPVEGAQKSAKPLTEFQGKAFSYGTRALDAHKILDEVGANYSPMATNIASSLDSVPGLASLSNAMLSTKDQQVLQAQRNFVNAVLRQESGATISPSEFTNARKQYFPQPGDTPDVIAQKKANRERAISSFKVESGPAASKFDEIQLQQPSANTQDLQAIQWAKSNPSDPRSAKILALHGM